jgi:hypothetical protein
MEAPAQRLAATRAARVRAFYSDTVHTGATCVYEPDPARPVTWMLDDLPTRSTP